MLSGIVSRYLKILSVSVVTWVMLASSALAQAAAEAKDEGKSYAPAYIVVLLCIVLGIFVTARAGRRTSEVKANSEYE